MTTTGIVLTVLALAIPTIALIVGIVLVNREINKPLAPSKGYAGLGTGTPITSSRAYVATGGFGSWM